MIPGENGIALHTVGHSESLVQVHVRWLLCAAGLVWQCTGLAVPVVVEVIRHGDAFEVQASADIEADRWRAWEVLTDYDRLAQFIPGMTSSRVISREGNTVVVEQNGEATLLFFRFPMQVRLAIEEYPPDRIESHALSGNFKTLQGTYFLENHGTLLRLRYVGKFTPDFNVPPLIGTFLVRNVLRKRFLAMIEEILKFGPPSPGRPQ
ncbi:MAG: SRPBCC family protein [Burkholderiales bacterium]